LLNQSPAKKVELHVKGTTQVHALSCAVAKHILEGSTVKLVSVGAAATSQMFKSAAKANEKLAPKGKFALWKAFFETIPVPEGVITASGNEEWSANVMESVIF
jgi:stage V sporulation protein SpoVS